MTTHAGLSDDRVEAIIANHEADPENGDDSHTPREVVQLAREVKARRAAERPPATEEARHAEHAARKRLNVFALATETIRSLARSGAIDLSGEPEVLGQLEECHRLLAGATGPLEFFGAAGARAEGPGEGG